MKKNYRMATHMVQMDIQAIKRCCFYQYKIKNPDWF